MYSEKISLHTNPSSHPNPLLEAKQCKQFLIYPYKEILGIDKQILKYILFFLL